MHVPTVVRTLLAGALVGAMTLPAAAAGSAPPVKKPTPYPSPSSNVTAPVELVEDVDGLKINWSTGRITVNGIGVPGDRGSMAFRRALSSRAATADAYRRFAAALELVRVDANTRLKDLAVVDDAMRTRLSDFVKAAKVLETNYWPDGSAEVVLGADLKGGASLATMVVKSPEAQPAASPEPSASAAPAKDVVTEPVALHATFSSLVIEAKGLGAQPAMLLNVRDSEGKIIDLNVGNARRTVKYLRDGAFLDPQAGINPLKVNASRTQGTLRADMVLSPADSQTLKSALLDKKIAEDAPLIIVL